MKIVVIAEASAKPSRVILPKGLSKIGYVAISLHLDFVLQHCKYSWMSWIYANNFCFILHVIKKGAVLKNGLYWTSRLLAHSGCHEEALGMENGKIPDSAIKANYEVNAIHIYTWILFDDISSGVERDTVN